MFHLGIEYTIPIPLSIAIFMRLFYLWLTYMKDIKIKSDRPALPRLAYSVVEAAQMTGLCAGTIRRMIYSGKLKASNVCQKQLIPASEMARILNTNSK
jgi:excisionase family DNA binding protein